MVGQTFKRNNSAIYNFTFPLNSGQLLMEEFAPTGANSFLSE